MVTVGNDHLDYARLAADVLWNSTVRSAVVAISLSWGLLALLIFTAPTGTKLTEYHLVHAYGYLGSGLISLVVLVRPALLLVRNARRANRARIGLGVFLAAVIAYAVVWYWFLGDAPFLWTMYLR